MAGETADSLFKVFESFASFGARGAAPLLDSAKFAKLCRDCSCAWWARICMGWEGGFAKTLFAVVASRMKIWWIADLSCSL